MRPEPRSTRTPDSGAILLLTLVMTVVFAILVAGIATYSSTALKSSRTTAGLVDTLAAAESGIQFELSTIDSGTCAPSTSRGTLNGANVTTTCQPIVRVADADTPFALVVTAVGINNPATRPALDTRGSNSQPNADRRIRGPIYLGDNVTVDLVQTSALLTDTSGTVFGGDVRYDVTGDCTGFGSDDGPTVASDWRTPQPVVRCDSRGWQAAAPLPDLSAYPVPATPMTSGGGGGCVVYSPGIRTGGILDLDDDSFFRSGVYYFHNVTILVDDDVAVGKRPPADYPSHVPASCASRNEFTTDPATGAMWILSGTSRIEFQNDSDAAFYPIAFADEDRSVVALHAAAYGYPASSLDPDIVRLIDRSNGAGPEFRFFGRVYAPGSWIDTGNAANDVVVEFMGGLVASRAVIQTAAQVDGFSISVDAALRTYFLIEAQAVADTDTIVRVTAEDLDPGTRVQTWRVCSQTGC